MIEQFFRPDSVEQALELKRRYQDEAVWFAGGSKLNATPTRTDKKIAISLQDLELDWVDWDNGALRIGAMSRLQPLRDADRKSVVEGKGGGLGGRQVVEATGGGGG